MPSSNGGRGGYKNKKDINTKDAAMIENLRGACPPHKKKDLDKLFKQMHGDETKIMEKIQEWWEEPVPTRQEESWEAVNKKVVKRKPAGDRRDRGRGGGRDSGGRGGSRGGGRGGRGGGRERNGKREDRVRDKKNFKSTDAEENQSTVATAKNEQQAAAVPVAPPVGIPTPVTAPVLKGAWGARAAASVPPTEVETSAAKVSEESATSAADSVEQAVPAAAAVAPKSSSPESNPLSAETSSSVQPPPVIASPTTAPPAAAPLPVPRVGGNVWATKGSAHLIQAEKEPVPAPAPPAPVVVEEPEIVAPPSPVRVEQPPSEAAPASSGPTLETGIPSWGNQAAPEPASEPATAPPAIELPIPTPPAPEPEPIVEKAVPEPVVAPVSVQLPPPPASPAAQKVLNMGRWDTGGGDDTDNIDFGFGSFGAVTSASDTNTNDIVQQVVNTEPTLSAATPGTSVSPARPPPGLSIGGMPPMPASAMSVHELENKLEGASLNTKTTAAEPVPAPGMHAPQQMTSMGQNALPSGLTQQNYNQQQLQHQVMPGMYNYNAGGAGFVGSMQPVLAGMPQQHGKPHGAGIGGHSQNGPQGSLPQQGLYGNQGPQGVPSSAAGTSSRAESSTTDANATGAAPTAGVPPGMPSTIPYANPALQYGAHHAAAQHQFYAMGGHQQQGIGYNYGYPGHAQQFGGAVQGGFGYPQVMGQSQGYGGSHYDDQGHQGNSHHSASGGYQNKSGGGGYRGRNAHTNNQYQNQYNPQQHGGYGGPTYGMGYHGHAQGGMTDPYGAMQHQQHGGIHSNVGGFQDDDHQKGRKGRGGNNTSLQQQFQQQGGPPQLGGQGQSFGLQQQQGGGIDSAPSSGGWPNQAAGGGWSGSAAQSGGWQGS